ncbi:GNAT family N-acetyltransferase [Haloactinopolyspora sp.]|uniref:GNAT family N-acetyltransferase n=1 Tax=Haloactinopolyspora sp. TaxID=1966353 RepID=UPI00260A30C3|nr:GNAT family N-acetyltransferase [Haloactinopolyspora sp.]
MSAPWSAQLPGTRVRIDVVPATSRAHAELVHDWMNRPHVVPWWRLGHSLDDIRRYLDGLTHLTPWIVSADGVAFGYVETYRVSDDPLAAAYDADDDDVGWHVAVGPVELLGTGVPRLLARAVLAYLFTDAPRAVCEPDVANARMLAFCRRLGLDHLGDVDLPDKRAALMACTRAAFDARWPGDRAAIQHNTR